MTPNPTIFEVVLLLPNEERSVQVGVEEHIWDAAFTAGVVLPALCHQGRCLTCAGWAQHPGPLTLSEILAIKEWLAEYITDVVDAYLGKKNT
jgi:hypothetical protein